MYPGIDTAVPLTAEQCTSIRKGGYLWVGRYLVPPAGYRKALTAAEAKRITEAGLRILTVWETTANRARSGMQGGEYDGERSLQCARNIGMPEGGCIYFAVDYDAPSSDYAQIEEYLRAAKRWISPYRIGVYGGYKVIDYMASHNVCDCYWQCMAWSYGKKHPARHVYQAKCEVKFLGIDTDTNECDNMDKAGIWNYRTTANPETAKDRYDCYDDLPSWSKETIVRYIKAGALKGGGKAVDQYGFPADLDLSMDMIRTIMIIDNMYGGK